MIFLYILDILSELIQLVFELGVFCRRYIVPALVFLYVGIEHYYEQLTSQELTLKVYRTPLTTGHAHL